MPYAPGTATFPLLYRATKAIYMAMLPAVRKHVRSRKFNLAIRFVVWNYAGLLPAATSIDLVRAAGRPPGLLGQFRCDGGRRIVEIINRRRGVAGLVNTIIHELTHASQEFEGCLAGMPRREAEEEATAAGREAMWDYLRVRGAH